MKQPFVLFDFDGVIANSFRTAFKAQKMICPVLTEAMYRERFEGNINDWEKAQKTHDKRCRHSIDFFSRYLSMMRREVRLVPGMSEVIKALAETYSLFIISSTTTSAILDFLKVYGLDDYFVEVLGNDVHTRKTEKIKMIFKKYTSKSIPAVFITDTLGDIEEARQAQIESIGVTWGFHEEKRLKKGKPVAIINKPPLLENTVNNYFKNELGL